MVQTMVSAPKDKRVVVEEKDGRMLTWSSLPGQTHYEIQYRGKQSTTWSTLGKVASTAKSFDLYDLYKILKKDFQEIHYRIVVYYDITGENYRDVGYEYSDVFRLMFVHQKTGEIQECIDDSPIAYPLYETVDDKTLPFVNIRLDGKNQKFPLVEEGSWGSVPHHSVAWKGQTRHFLAEENQGIGNNFQRVYGVGVWTRDTEGTMEGYGVKYSPLYQSYLKKTNLYYNQKSSKQEGTREVYYTEYQTVTIPYQTTRKVTNQKVGYYNTGYGPSSGTYGYMHTYGTMQRGYGYYYYYVTYYEGCYKYYLSSSPVMYYYYEDSLEIISGTRQVDQAIGTKKGIMPYYSYYYHPMYRDTVYSTEYYLSGYDTIYYPTGYAKYNYSYQYYT